MDIRTSAGASEHFKIVGAGVSRRTIPQEDEPVAIRNVLTLRVACNHLLGLREKGAEAGLHQVGIICALQRDHGASKRPCRLRCGLGRRGRGCRLAIAPLKQARHLAAQPGSPLCDAPAGCLQTPPGQIPRSHHRPGRRQGNILGDAACPLQELGHHLHPAHGGAHRGHAAFHRPLLGRMHQFVGGYHGIKPALAKVYVPPCGISPGAHALRLSHGVRAGMEAHIRKVRAHLFPQLGLDLRRGPARDPLRHGVRFRLSRRILPAQKPRHPRLHLGIQGIPKSRLFQAVSPARRLGVRRLYVHLFIAARWNLPGLFYQLIRHIFLLCRV